MSLSALSRYDDAEDEILDEDHNLVLKQLPTDEVEPIPPSSLPSSRPSSSLGKPKGLVSYLGEYSDDDDDNDGSSSEQEDNIDTPLNPSIVSSTGSVSPSSVNGNPEGAEQQTKERLDSITLPPEPEGRCSKSLQEKVIQMMEKKNNGMNVNEYVQKRKAFRNPSIYDKLVSYIGIDEHGTNFPKHLYDPSIWGPESYYDELAKAQKEHHDKKEKEKLKEKRAQVEFVTGVKKPLSHQGVSATTDKKSKWDQKIPPSIQAAVKSNAE